MKKAFVGAAIRCNSCWPEVCWCGLSFSCVRRLENARNGSDRSYHVWSGLIERASSFLSWFRHDMSQTSDPLLVIIFI